MDVLLEIFFMKNHQKIVLEYVKSQLLKMKVLHSILYTCILVENDFHIKVGLISHEKI